VGRGAEDAVQKQIERLAAAHLAIEGFWDSKERRYYPLTDDDVIAIQTELSSAEYVAPLAWMPSDVWYRGRTLNGELTAVSSKIFDMYNLRSAEGRLYDERDEAYKRNVVVVASAVAARLAAQTRRIIGEPIRIGNLTYEVIGVLEETGNPDIPGLWRCDERIFVPVSTTGGNRVSAIYIRAESSADVEFMAMQTERILRHSKRLNPGEPNRFRIVNLFDLGRIQETASQTFSELLTAIATISLIVGGLGIVNIMLVSVTERTREIGVRKALGARQINILMQFLAEAVILCMVGGFVGIGVGYLFAETVVKGAGWAVIVTPDSIVLGVVVAIVVGIIGGVWPAVRAARMDPVEALRYE
jgi:putative ABC transport system permease protein